MGAIANIAELLPEPQAEPKPATMADFAGAVAVRDGLDAPARMRVPEAELELARAKATAVAMYATMRESRGLSRQEAARRIAADDSPRLAVLAAAGKGGTSAISARNLDNWTRACEGAKAGDAVEALTRNYAACGRRQRVGHPKFWLYWQTLYLSRQQKSIAQARREAAMECRREGIGNEDIPSLAQVRYWRSKHIDPAQETLARFGEDAFKQGFQFFIDRRWDDIGVGEILFSDHHTLDAPCKIWSEEKERWEACRPTLTAFMDAKSWYITGWQISAGAGNSETIMNTLALSLINMGMTTPKYIYTDNGADYESTGFGQPAEYQGQEYSVIKSLGISVINSLPYAAQAKTIERQFLNVCGGFSKRWGGYVGEHFDLRSEIADYYWQHPEELPSLEQLCSAFAHWLEDELHQQPNDGKICTGKTPAEGWAMRQPLSHVWSRDDMYFAFLVPRAVRQVRRGPCVRHQNRFYFSGDLMPYIAKTGDRDKVLVYEDRFDRERIFVRTHDDHVLECRSKQSIRAVAETDEERAKIAEAQALKGRQLKQAYTAIDGLTGGTYKLADPMQRILALRMGEDASIKRVDQRASVKGGNHLYKHYKVVSREEAEAKRTAAERDEDQGREFRAQLQAQIRRETVGRDQDEWSELCGAVGIDADGDEEKTEDGKPTMADVLKRRTNGGEEW